ncbi:sensor histidine kinase [Allomuricauda sp. SCSIO 65647]|uniref:sensor histidine kinase n=1 Tax=Allomuricauda sp. SCSIO 65647 TaxID=2908843 RepID=UPI001F446EC3|nr:histidine kinase dimerization/phosphoacceptor domain -containing protein [Muricauda sp. SCSIO 65647]UJH67765.1 tetratricopeptide repeat protein [Muricauda sp. SCSIO 65647]
MGQIIDLNSEKPYKKVFVDTDNFGASYLDILKDTYPKAQPDSLKFSMLSDLAYYSHTRDLVMAMDYTEAGLKLTEQKKDTLWQGRFQIIQGAILLRMEKLEDAEMVLEEAKRKVRKSDLAFLYTQLGYVYERRGELDKAADYALESLRLGEELKDKKAIALAYSDLSNLFWKQSRFTLGLEYGLKSLEIFEERNINDLDYDFTLYVVGNNYLNLKKYKKALNYYEHSIAIGERYGFYNNLSDVYISLVDLYAYLNEYEKAEAAGANALKYAELLNNNNFMVMRSWLSIGKLQNLQGKYASAVESLKRCITIATDEFGDEFYLSQAYETLGKAYAGNHNYREAYLAFAEYDKLKDLIFTAEADQRISLLQTEFDVAQKEGTIIEQETHIKKQKTRQTFVLIISGLLLLLLVLSYKAIQNNVKKNRLLQRQNKEKEFLLKEIHHRVKNNLEIVSSLLSLQSAQMNDPDMMEAMQKSQQRVQSMSMIHQKLYQGRSLAAIEMKDYFVNLGNYVIATYGASEHITLQCEMDELELDVDMAIPVGLIVNELLTNAMKYAFPNKKNGQIVVSLFEKGTHLFLKVSDNGVGHMAEELNERKGFGTQLIKLLTQQLDGKMTLSIDKGTSVSFEFQYHKAA